MINNLPNGWKIEKLANIVNRMHQGINTAADKVEFSMDGYPIIQTRNITKGILDFDNIKYINESDWEKYKNKYKPEINQILLTNIGTIGKSVIVKKDEDYLIHWNIFLIEPKNELISSNYLKSFFDKLYENKYYDLFLKGGTVKFISKSFLIDLEIPIPPLQQQEKIVKVLDLSSNLIEKQKKLLKKYDLFLKSKFIEMFGNPIKNTMKWETAQIKEVIVKVKNDNPLKEPQKKYIYIDIGSINDKYIKHYNCILGENAPSRAKQITIYNDILVSTVRPNLNAVAIVKSKYESILSSTGFCVLRTNNKNITPYYLFEIVKHKDFIQSLMNVAKGASYPAVSNNDILNLKISIPPLEQQNKFASIVEKIEIIKEKENQKLKQLEDLHNSLMQKAFKGEIE